MFQAPISATTVAVDSEHIDEAQETAPLLDAVRLEKLDVYNRLPEKVKAKLKTYGAFQTHTNVELHRMLNDIRNEFIIPPWHPFTWFIKKESEGSISGNELIGANRWIVRNTELSDYYEDPMSGLECVSMFLIPKQENLVHPLMLPLTCGATRSGIMRPRVLSVA